MALYPCDHCGRRYTGAQSTIYPAVAKGLAVVRQKQRLCPDCFDSAENFLEENNEPLDSRGTPRQCTIDGDEGPLAVFFVTAYSHGSARADYAGLACHTCVDQYLSPHLFGVRGLPTAPKGVWAALQALDGEE